MTPSKSWTNFFRSLCFLSFSHKTLDGYYLPYIAKKYWGHSVKHGADANCWRMLRKTHKPPLTCEIPSLCYKYISKLQENSPLAPNLYSWIVCKVQHLVHPNFQSFWFEEDSSPKGAGKGSLLAVEKFVLTLSLPFLWATFRAARLSELWTHKLQKLFYQLGNSQKGFDK